jgi:hypothetical protein
MFLPEIDTRFSSYWIVGLPEYACLPECQVEEQVVRPLRIELWIPLLG